MIPRCRWCKRKLERATVYIHIAPEWQATDTVATVRYMERIKAGEVVSFDRGYYPGQSIHTPASERPIVGVRVWDGKSYRGKPARLPIFCKPACGVEFALDAHQHGHRRRS